MPPFSDEHRPLYEVKANLFRGLAHPLRVRILEVLAAHDEVSVAELLADTGVEQSHLSQHLAVLRRYNLVASERRAGQVYYRVAHSQIPDLMAVSRSLLVEILEHTHHQLVSTVSMPAPGTSARHTTEDTTLSSGSRNDRR